MKLLFVDIGPASVQFLKCIELTTSSESCYFLEHYSKTSDFTRLEERGKLVFWEDYSDAFELIRSINPDKIVFVLLDDYYHIALRLAAKEIGAKTYFVDHGIRFEHEVDILEDIERLQIPPLKRVIKKLWVTSFLALCKNRFYVASIWRLPKSQRVAALRTFMARCMNYYTVFMQSHGRQLLTDQIIAYSEETFSFYKRFFSIPDDWNGIIYIGIPSMDGLSELCSTNVSLNNKDVLFIDQPLHEQNILNWTSDRKREFVLTLHSIVKENQGQLYIKPHPHSEDYYSTMPEIKIGRIALVKEITPELFSHIGFVGSFNSTLLLPFCANSSVVSFCIEMHPILPALPLSIGITKYSVATPITSFEQLPRLFSDKNAVLKSKKEHLGKFIEKMLYRIDGQSTKRLNEALLNN